MCMNLFIFIIIIFFHFMVLLLLIGFLSEILAGLYERGLKQ